MQAFPVQVKPVWEKPAQEKPFLGKKAPKAGILGRYLTERVLAPMHRECAQTGAFLATTGAVCGNVAGWVCIQLLAGEQNLYTGS